MNGPQKKLLDSIGHGPKFLDATQTGTATLSRFAALARQGRGAVTFYPSVVAVQNIRVNNSRKQGHERDAQ